MTDGARDVGVARIVAALMRGRIARREAVVQRLILMIAARCPWLFALVAGLSFSGHEILLRES